MKKYLLSLALLFSVLGFSQLTEDFEATTFPPTGWAVFDNGIGPAQSWQRTTISTLTYNGSAGAAFLNRETVAPGTTAEDWLVTSQVNVPANGQLRFFTRTTLNGDQGSVYTIRVSTASQTTAADFTTVQTWTETDLVTTYNQYEAKTVDLSAYASQNVYIAFVMANNGGDRWLVDDVFVEMQCLDITSQTVTAILDTSANLGWDNPSGATEWEIEWGPAGFTQGSGTVVTGVTTNPYPLPNLTAETSYDFYVRAICTNGNTSAWAGPQNFTTTVAPPQCGGSFFDEGGSTGNYSSSSDYTVTICPDNSGDAVAVFFSSFNTEANYDALYVYDGDSTAAPQIASTNGSGTVPGGVAGGFWGTDIPGPFFSTHSSGCLTFRFRSDGSVTRSGWEASIVCSPAPTCSMPSALGASNIGMTEATLSWTDNNGTAPSGGWQIIIQAPGTGYPTSTTGAITAPTNPYTVTTGLSSDTAYEYYVAADCGSGDVSYFAGPFSFSTLPNYCAGDHFVDSGGASGNYSSDENLTWTICPDNPGDAVSVFFNSFNVDDGGDALYVFDGDSTSATQIASSNGAGTVPGGLAGGFWGDVVPGPFVGTTASGCLTFQFISNSSLTADGWDATVLCGTAPTCIMPSNVTVSNITDTEATFSWVDNNSPNATSWQVIIQPAGTGYPTSTAGAVTVNSNPYTATNLNATTNYEIYVAADCGGGNLSYFAGLPFSTLFPGCGGNAVAGNEISAAAAVCSLNGYCGNTSASYTDSSWPELDTAFCGSIENNSFLFFEATSTSISMDVNVSNCTNGSDIQFFVFTASTLGSGPVNGLDCYFQMNVGTNSLTFNGLTPGQTYYLMIDGFAGAVCDYAITVTSGGSTSTDVAITQNNQTICVNETLTLDVTGGNGNYTWSPAAGLDVTTGNQVVFTPPAPGVYSITVETDEQNTACNTADVIEVTVLDTTYPSFPTPGQICAGDPNIPLSTTSTDGVTGQWTLAGTTVTSIDTSVAGNFNYIFTPDASFQCVQPLTFNIEVLGTCTFNAYATAVNIKNCETSATGDFFNVTGAGTNLIGNATDTYTSTNFGVYLQNSGNLLINGAELRSFKTTTSNVCNANLYYRVYEASATPGTFTAVPLPFLEDCAGGTFPSGGSCNTGDQKWQELTTAIDLTTNNPGDYIVDVYFDVVGDGSSTTGCSETIVLDNSGNYFSANFSIQATPTFASTDEQCASANGSITASGFYPGNVYAVSFNDDGTPYGPINYTSNANGDIVISGLNAGVYDNFTFTVDGCDITVATAVTIVDFSPSVTAVNSSNVCEGSDVVFTITATPNFSIDYIVNAGTTETVAVDATGTATITVPAPAVGNVDLVLQSIHNASCNITLTNTNTAVVNPLPTATILANAPFTCLGSDASFTITGTPNASVSYTQNGGAAQTVTLDATGSYVLNIATTTNVQIALVEVTNTTTNCVNTAAGQIADVVIVNVPTPTATYSSCTNGPSTVEVTSPLISQLNYPADIFLSEITRSIPGSLVYVEIYNGTGSAVDLSNYKLKVFKNGNTTAACDEVLSGTLNNDDVIVIKLGTSADEGGVTPDLTLNTCSGGNINNNDRIAIANSTDVIIDVWGTPDGTIFTPNNGIGYNYQRKVIGTTLPSINWDTTDWNETNWNNPSSNEDYSTVGNYTIYSSNFEYTLTGTTTVTQTATTFTNVAPGTYALTAYDAATGCTSSPYDFTINSPITIAINPVQVCINESVTLPTVSDNAGTVLPGTWSPTMVDTSSEGTTSYVFTPTDPCYLPSTFQVEAVACLIPKGISPNNDGKNDSFDLSGYPVKKLSIFNRYGRKVYGKDNYTNEWIGQSDNGNDLPTGTYYYVIELDGENSRTGWVYINREE